MRVYPVKHENHSPYSVFNPIISVSSASLNRRTKQEPISRSYTVSAEHRPKNNNNVKMQRLPRIPNNNKNLRNHLTQSHTSLCSMHGFIYRRILWREKARMWLYFC